LDSISLVEKGVFMGEATVCGYCPACEVDRPGTVETRSIDDEGSGATEEVWVCSVCGHRAIIDASEEIPLATQLSLFADLQKLAFLDRRAQAAN